MAHALAQGMKILAAYHAAGYVGKTTASAASVSGRPEVKARVQEIIATQHTKEIRSNERAIDNAAIDKGWIVTRAKYIVDRAVRGTKPVYGDGGAITGWMPRSGDETAAIKGLTLLAHMGGYMVTQVEVGAPGDFARMTDDELNKELILVGESIGLSGPVLQKALAYHSEETE